MCGLQLWLVRFGYSLRTINQHTLLLFLTIIMFFEYNFLLKLLTKKDLLLEFLFRLVQAVRAQHISLRLLNLLSGAEQTAAQ